MAFLEFDFDTFHIVSGHNEWHYHITIDKIICLKYRLRKCILCSTHGNWHYLCKVLLTRHKYLLAAFNVEDTLTMRFKFYVAFLEFEFDTFHAVNGYNEWHYILLFGKLIYLKYRLRKCILCSTNGIWHYLCKVLLWCHCFTCFEV